jgi:hypothetical protein
MGLLLEVQHILVIMNVVCERMLQAGRSQVPFQMRSLNLFSMYLILPAVLGPGFHLATNRDKYLKEFLGSKARSELKVDNLTAMSKPVVQTM